MTDRDRFLAFCGQQIEKPYKLGESGPDEFDCSGLILGGLEPLTSTEISRISTDQYALGFSVDFSEALPGDLIFFDTGWVNRKPNHLGVCIGNGMMINANSYRNKVAEESYFSEYWSKKIWGARRIFDENGKVNISGVDIPEVSDFADVPKNHPDYEYIMELREKGIIHGFFGNLFKPQQIVTRAEAAKIILLAFEIPVKQAAQSSFSDVKPTDWFLSILETGKNKKIIDGYSDGTFKPKNPINRAEICKIILKTGKVNIPKLAESKFLDNPLDSWFADFVHEADARQMFVLEGNQFFPAANVTRAEMCRSIAVFLRSA